MNEIYNFIGILPRENYPSLSDEEYEQKLKKRIEELIRVAEKMKDEENEERIRKIKYYYSLISNKNFEKKLEDNNEEHIITGKDDNEGDLNNDFSKAFLSSFNYEPKDIKASVNLKKIPELIDVSKGFEHEIYIAGTMELSENMISKNNGKKIHEFYYRINEGLDSKGTFLKTELDMELMNKDEKYREFVLKTLFSKEAIELAKYYTGGYVGVPIKDRRTGEWKRYIEPIFVAISRRVEELKERGMLSEPRIPQNIINQVDDREI